ETGKVRYRSIGTTPGKAGASEAASSRPKRAREPPVNAIEVSRKPVRNQNAQPEAAVAEGAAAPSTSSGPPAASPRQPADADPWPIAESVRDRFVQDGHRFFFPDGASAFKDRGRRLTTVSENTQVIHSLIEIAQSRGWTEVTVTGTERFRQQAWQQARLAG